MEETYLLEKGKEILSTSRSMEEIEDRAAMLLQRPLKRRKPKYTKITDADCKRPGQI